MSRLGHCLRRASSACTISQLVARDAVQNSRIFGSSSVLEADLSATVRQTIGSKQAPLYHITYHLRLLAGEVLSGNVSC